MSGIIPLTHFFTFYSELSYILATNPKFANFLARIMLDNVIPIMQTYVKNCVP
jgi:hypothetical protein